MTAETFDTSARSLTRDESVREGAPSGSNVESERVIDAIPTSEPDFQDMADLVSRDGVEQTASGPGCEEELGVMADLEADAGLTIPMDERDNDYIDMDDSALLEWLASTPSQVPSPPQQVQAVSPQSTKSQQHTKSQRQTASPQPASTQQGSLPNVGSIRFQPTQVKRHAMGHRRLRVPILAAATMVAAQNRTKLWNLILN